MEEWEIDFDWLRVRHWVKDRFNKEKLPDLNAVLFVIGIQELGAPIIEFTKEQKQDLMHIATCRLLSDEGYYGFKGIDADGWPHWERIANTPILELREEELLLKKLIVRYFKAQNITI